MIDVRRTIDCCRGTTGNRWYITSITFALVGLVQQPFSSVIVEAERSAIFGTSNGYDVGGIQPICYRTNILKDPNFVDTDGTNYTAIELLNDGIFGTGSTSSNDNTTTNNIELLTSCYVGTKLQVLPPVDIGSDRLLLTGTPYTFHLHLSADVSQINSDIAIQSLNGKSTIFFRLLLCDAIRHGFCRPIIDTRAVDSTVTRDMTDVGAPPNSTFPNDANRWVYTPNITLKGIKEEDDGLLVFSRWCRWTLRQLKPEQPLFNTTANISMQLPLGIRSGAYFFVGHTVLNFDLPDQNTILRIDVASAIPDNVVEVRDPPNIQTVSNGMKIGLGVAIGIFGTIALGIFIFIFVQRNHAVMKLAQGSFLGAIAGAAFMEIVCTFVFLPTQDIYCKLQGPLIFIPMTFMASCLVGRIWRVYKILAVMNRFARLDKHNKGHGDCIISFLYGLARLPFSCCSNRTPPTAQSRKNFRQAVSANETLSLIVLLTLPQFLFQVIIAAMSTVGLETQLDDTGTIGRIVCSTNDDWVINVGMSYVAAVYALAVVVAWISRSLPSAFNEKVQIFNAAATCTILAFIAIALISISSDPGTHPDIQVFLRSFLSIGVAVCVLFFIVWPKVYRVLNGEKVVMSNYLATELRNASVSITDDHHTGSTPSTRFTSRREKKTSLTSSNNDLFRIYIKKDDPLPASVASKIVESESLLREVTDKFAEGRPLLSKDLTLLQEEIGMLHTELTLIQIDEGTSSLHLTNDEQNDIPRSRDIRSSLETMEEENEKVTFTV